MDAIMIRLAVVIAIVVATAIFTSLIVFLAPLIAKAARCGKLKYFNIRYRDVYSNKFCRAHLVGKVDWPNNKVLYVVEIHPKDAAKACAWTVPETKLHEGHLLEKGKFYKLAFKEELYD